MIDSPIVADFESFVTTRAWFTKKWCFECGESPTSLKIPHGKDFMKTLL